MSLDYEQSIFFIRYCYDVPQSDLICHCKDSFGCVK